MSLTTGRVFSDLTRLIFSGRISNRINCTRALAMSSHLTAKSNSPNEDEVNNEPIKFSTSKASHRTWKVERSMGSQYERPWWKVLPISFLGVAFLLWCFLREETEIDAQLEKQLFEQLPGLLSDEKPEKVKDE